MASQPISEMLKDEISVVVKELMLSVDRMGKAVLLRLTTWVEVMATTWVVDRDDACDVVSVLRTVVENPTICVVVKVEI